ncbi:hypothetical protein [Halodesulfurarchaeum sp.]|uniref:hypothetical protein n=1 Tax=Halodesulfurarchaeum sp. TaxID=1980530 RepID=UPI002FC39803
MQFVPKNPIEPIILASDGGFALEAWQIGAVAFAFVGVILLVTFLLERWGVGLHA